MLKKMAGLFTFFISAWAVVFPPASDSRGWAMLIDTPPPWLEYLSHPIGRSFLFIIALAGLIFWLYEAFYRPLSERLNIIEKQKPMAVPQINNFNGPVTMHMSDTLDTVRQTKIK
jgi:hypothetical protein